MSLPTRHLLDDEEGALSLNASAQRIRTPRKQQSNSAGKICTPTLARRIHPNTEMATVYNTLTRNNTSAVNYAKIKSLATFTNLYLNNKELGIAEEELRYLKAVESGDLDEVRTILNSNEVSCSDSENEDTDATFAIGKNTKKNAKRENNNLINVSMDRVLRNEHVNETANSDDDRRSDEIPTTSSSEHSHKIASPVRKSYSATSGKSVNKPDSVVLEMKEVRVKTTNVRRSSMTSATLSGATPSKWQMVHSQKASSATPLPVMMSTPEQSRADRIKRRETLKKFSGLPPTAKNELRFNKNCRDQWGRSALFIAMLHHNIEMMELLLKFKVEVDECLYHAIDFGYYDIVELFMEHDKTRNQVITGEDSFYPPGLTPIQLAAHKNDYVMLKILHLNGFKISNENIKKRGFSHKLNLPYNTSTLEKTESKSVLEKAWDATNNDILYYRAKASPAYMVMMFTENPDDAKEHWDMLENLFSLYRRLKNKASAEPAAASLYRQLANQVEDFACDLLSEVRSPSDLTDLLRFEPPGQEEVTMFRHYLCPIERACEVRMKSFVAHENCQLALSTLRQGTVFESDTGWRPLVVRILLSLIFPILSIAFLIAPNSKPGRLLSNPMVNLSCHIASEVTFLVLMLVRLILKTNLECDCLGKVPDALEYFIFVWIIAKGWRYFGRLRESPTYQFLTNVWNMNDSGMLFLTFLIAILTIVDVKMTESVTKSMNLNLTCIPPVYHQPASGTDFDLCNRETWLLQYAWPIYIMELSYALIYILIFVRAMELLYIDRTFGPLQLSLDKMMVDIFRFLVLFAVTFMAFAFGMTQLYWAYGTPRLFRMNVKESEICGDDPDFENGTGTCYPVYSDIISSILEQYWTLYGYGYGREPTAAVKVPGQSTITFPAGLFLSMVFHMWAVVVMLNMLIAMMSHSFERVRDNAEIEWKYHKSSMWMRFIKMNSCPRPCPMNILPTVQNIVDFFTYAKAKCLCRCGMYETDSETPERHNARKAVSSDSIRENKRYRQAITRISTRYLRRYLLPDFKHDVGDPSNKSSKKPYSGHRGSIISSDLSSS